MGIVRCAVAEKLADLHLADLHARAAELGVPRFRLLRREDLAREIEARGGGEGAGGEAQREPAAVDEPAPTEAGRPTGRGRRSDSEAGSG